MGSVGDFFGDVIDTGGDILGGIGDAVGDVAGGIGDLVGSLDLATRGKIFLNGTNIEQLDESDLAQLRGKKIGFIFQQFNLIQNLSYYNTASIDSK
jgi:putative ABC transport system ATP-binding protein